MRIAFYSPRASHLELELRKGGDPFMLRDLLSALRDRGHEIEIASFMNVHDLWRGRVTARQLIAEALRVKGRMRRFRPDAWLTYKPSRTYPDVFGWWHGPARYVLMSAHNWQSQRIPRRWRSFLAWNHRQSLSRADLVTTETQTRLDRLRETGVDADRLRLYAPPVRVETSLPSQQAARRRLSVPDGIPVVFCATRFPLLKDWGGKTEMIFNLLSAVRSLPRDALVLLAGNGPGRSQIEAEVMRLEIGDRVQLVGEVDNRELRWFFAACDVYAYPYELDYPATSILEAQAHARPVVAIRTKSAELTIDAGRSGSLAETANDFPRHLAQLVRDRSRAAEFGRAAHRYIDENHSVRVWVQRIENVAPDPATSSTTND